MAVGGPSEEGFPTGFATFGKTVLGSPAPSKTDLRSDYFSYDRFDQARTFLNGGTRRAKLAQTYPDRARRIRAAGGLPQGFNAGPPEPELLAEIVAGTSPILRALDPPTLMAAE